MSVVSPPTPLTPDVPASVRPPNNAQQLAVVVLQNVSPYLVTVTANAGVYTLPAYTSDVFATASGGTQIGLLPTNPDATTGVSANILATWYGPDEIPDAGIYPAALTPPPIGVAIAVARQLQEDVQVCSRFLTVLAPGGSTAVFDVATYQSLSVRTGAIGAVGSSYLLFDWGDGGTPASGIGGTILLENIDYPSQPGVIPADGGFLVPVRSSRVQITNSGPATVSIEIWGTQRPYQKLVNNGFQDITYVETGAVAWLLNQQITLAVIDPASGHLPQGLCQVSLELTNAAMTGQWFATVIDDVSTSRKFWLATTLEALNYTGAPARLIVNKQIIMPAAPYSIGFIARTAGNANVTATLVSVGQ